MAAWFIIIDCRGVLRATAIFPTFFKKKKLNNKPYYVTQKCRKYLYIDAILCLIIASGKVFRFRARHFGGSFSWRMTDTCQVFNAELRHQPSPEVSPLARGGGWPLGYWRRGGGWLLCRVGFGALTRAKVCHANLNNENFTIENVSVWSLRVSKFLQLVQEVRAHSSRKTTWKLRLRFSQMLRLRIAIQSIIWTIDPGTAVFRHYNHFHVTFLDAALSQHTVVSYSIFQDCFFSNVCVLTTLWSGRTRVIVMNGRQIVIA